MAPASLQSNSEDDPNTLTENVTCEDNPTEGTVCSPVLQPPVSAERTAAMFLLTFKEKYKLPQASIHFAVGAINQIVDRVCESIKEDVENNEATRFQYQDPFASLQSEYQQTKFYHTEFVDLN